MTPIARGAAGSGGRQIVLLAGATPRAALYAAAAFAAQLGASFSLGGARRVRQSHSGTA